MDGPNFFILFMVAGILALAFLACILTGAVWLFFGWRKKVPPLKFVSALPFGVGFFIIAPLLLLLLLFIAWWFIADWRAPARPSKPATEEQR